MDTGSDKFSYFFRSFFISPTLEKLDERRVLRLDKQGKSKKACPFFFFNIIILSKCCHCSANVQSTAEVQTWEYSIIYISKNMVLSLFVVHSVIILCHASAIFSCGKTNVPQIKLFSSSGGAPSKAGLAWHEKQTKADLKVISLFTSQIFNQSMAVRYDQFIMYCKINKLNNLCNNIIFIN